MTQTDNSAIRYPEHNRKKAYFAMCKASLLLCLSTALSYAFNYAVITLCLGKYLDVTQKVIVRFLMLFGAPELMAITAVRNLLSSVAFLEMIQMLGTFLGLILPVAVFAKSAGLSGDECFPVGGRFAKWLLPTAGFCQICITFVLKFAYIISGTFVSPIFGPALSETFFPAGVLTGESGFYDFIISAIVVCVFVPFAEEFAFRGVFFSYLRRYGTAFGMVASSFIFGIAHSSPEQAVFAFAFGIMASFLVVVTGNIKTAVLCHALNNFIYLVENYTIGTDLYYLFCALRLIIYVLGFFGLYYLVRKGGHMDAFTEKAVEEDGYLAYRPGLKEIFAFPTIAFVIVYIVSFIGDMIG